MVERGERREATHSLFAEFSAPHFQKGQVRSPGQVGGCHHISRQPVLETFIACPGTPQKMRCCWTLGESVHPVLGFLSPGEYPDTVTNASSDALVSNCDLTTFHDYDDLVLRKAHFCCSLGHRVEQTVPEHIVDEHIWALIASSLKKLVYTCYRSMIRRDVNQCYPPPT